MLPRPHSRLERGRSDSLGKFTALSQTPSPWLDSKGPTSTGKGGGMRPIFYSDLGDRSPWLSSWPTTVTS